MKAKIYIRFILVILFFSTLFSCSQSVNPEWPEITRETKPWTRWWWMGSAVDTSGLNFNMKQLKNAGIGGMEITPIYGVKGHEKQSIRFQSEKWMEMLDFTLSEAERIDLGIDLANASGWPFGGPWIDKNFACKNFQFKIYKISKGERLSEPVIYIQKPLVRAVGNRVDISEIKDPISSNTNLQNLALDQVRFEKPLPLQVLMAYGENGEISNLTKKVNSEGILNWIAPEGDWNLYAVFQGWHGKQVERAGPGGEGNVIDHFSQEAVKTFLDHFDQAAANIDVTRIRAFFNDSYEVDDAYGEANWTPLFFEEFQNRRGYDLRDFLPAFFNNNSEEINTRIRMDYRETISDLLLERFTNTWAQWADSHQAAVRNQAHDSPANILDLYAASGIPETEGTDPLGIKFASSAAHVTGKKLVSCEAATWLDEHFTAGLSDLKKNIDRYFSYGVNHIVYHGTPYSPEDAKWPGWMFYASTHLAPTNPLWEDLLAINKYVARCQSFLQDSKPANDILVYFPMYDYWAEKGRSTVRHMEENARNTPVKKIGDYLLEKGYTFDFISERQIKKLETNGDLIISSGNEYKTIIIPECQYFPIDLIEKLLALAESGVTVIFQNNLPETVPGLFNLEERKKFYEGWKESIQFLNNEKIIGKGKFLVGDDLEELFTKSKVLAEEYAKEGLWLNRMDREDGRCYWISNWSDHHFDGWLNVKTIGKDAVIFNPMSGEKGKAQIRKLNDNKSAVYLQLKKGETCILQFYETLVEEVVFPFYKQLEDSILISGNWEIEFTKAGHELPAKMNLSELKSWSEIASLEDFSGTAVYLKTIKRPAVSADVYNLDLGEVYESARVFLNGEELAVLIGPEYQVNISEELLVKENLLEIYVSNGMANRIIGMEKRGEKYQNFYNINFSAKYRENLDEKGVFTTKGWEYLKSGLLGPVVLKPMIRKEFIEN